MAHVFKPTYTQALPENAEVLTGPSGPYVRVQRKGRVVKARVVTPKRGKHAGQPRLAFETDEWYVLYQDGNGKWRRKKGYTDRSATASLGVRLEKQAARRREGLVDPFEEHHRRPLAERLDEFHRNLEARNVGGATDILRQARLVVDRCRFQAIQDLSASAVVNALAELRRERNWAPQTYNHYLAAIKKSSKWLKADRRTGDDPLAELKRVEVQVDRRHDRQALEAEEVDRLLAAALAGPPIEGVSGPDRAALYLVSGWTG